VTSGARRIHAARAAQLAGVAAAFVAAVDLTRWIRPGVLTDPEPAWALPRLLLGLFVVAGTAAAGVLAASAFLLARRFFDTTPTPLPFSRFALALVAAAALGGGALLRFVSLDTLPPSLWIDDVSLIAPALALSGSLSDFDDAIRSAPYGVGRPYGSVGVLYLELYRTALLLFGTTVFGVRLLSAAAGVASILTALLLGRALLPRGGGTVAALALAGMRWHLILSRWGWNAVVLAPAVDVAALLLLRARRRDSLLPALAAGVVAGLAAHVYLAAWVAATALLLLAVWPSPGIGPPRRRFPQALLFLVGFACAAAPLFLLREGRTAPYFARASDHSLAAEIRYARSVMPAFAAAADSLAGPWFMADPVARNDLPGRSRLGWILAIPLGVALARSLLQPREELSAYLLSQAGAALAASVAGGHAGVPNGYRFGYLCDAAAVAVAGGFLCLLAVFPAPRRRAAALAGLGLVALSGALGARDALLAWPQRRETFDGFHGQDTLLARAALRWERLGTATVSGALGHSPITIEGVRRFRLDPCPGPEGSGRSIRSSQRAFRIAPPDTAPQSGERPVERLRDAWGREWAVVIGRREPYPSTRPEQ
jgi:Dolichyl-phosphate-mannose-protein mannosyltransferase